MTQSLRSYGNLGKKWWHRSWGERLLLFEALIYLALARVLVSRVPFGRFAHRLGQPDAPPVAHMPAAQQLQARRVGAAIRSISRHVPWHNTCLMQAIAAKAMLQRRRVSSTLYLGVARTNDQQLEAHAWLQCGPHVLTGGKGRHKFTVIATFTERHL